MIVEAQRDTVTIVSAWSELAGIEAEIVEWVDDPTSGRSIGAWAIITGRACLDAGKDPTTFAQPIGPNHPVFLSTAEIGQAQGMVYAA